MKVENVSQLCGLAVAAALILPALGCGKSNKNHVAVHPVQGTIQFRGQPIEGAFVSLYPTSAIEGVPAPRATVAKDGSFAVTTYDGSDGAPEGEYVLTVQWYKPVRQNSEVVSGPNALPPKYALAKTSDLRITVAAGENQLNPIQIR